VGGAAREDGGSPRVESRRMPEEEEKEEGERRELRGGMDARG